ncbi:DUF2278 family protein [Kitasatospora herbaricolor]|uniref:YukJ family protein n=1 Tax=Kitasatospora herbaricolor TaxID=68217 RepID=A0ABZ1W8S0_9ACTN|nr:DUF2278 family protein [Kitasatospora herbaricolor]
MPLAHYGVTIGTFDEFHRDPTHEYGHWYHGHVRLNTPQGQYEAALDVDAPAVTGVSYRLVDDLRAADLATVRALPDGFHPLDSNPGSGALDYARSPQLRNRLWVVRARAVGRALSRTLQRPAIGAPAFGPDLVDLIGGWLAGRRIGVRFFPWIASNGDNALDVLEPHLRAASRIYVFGQAFTEGLGVHDVHQNQGDPPGDHYAANGIWQDGAVVCEHPDGRIVAWQLKFNTQTLSTDEHGNPKLP